jgi:hypothetical protein
MGRKEVLTAEPNIVVRQEQHYRPKDSLYPQQWYLNNAGANQVAASSHISVEKAWDITRGVRSVVVAVTMMALTSTTQTFKVPEKSSPPKTSKTKTSCHYRERKTKTTVPPALELQLPKKLAAALWELRLVVP